MITIDARWIYASGIGTYLRQIIPGIVKQFNRTAITLLGDSRELKKLLGNISHNCFFVDAHSGMYSIREQIDYVRLIPSTTSLYFAPHYNIPLFYSGQMLVVVHDLMHLAMPQFVHGYHRHLYAKLMFSAVRHKATSILTVSDFSKTEFLRLCGESPQTITPIHLGVDDGWYSIRPGPPPHPRPYVLCVGNIKPHKNLSALVKAFASIVDFVPHDLVMVGKREGFITGDRDVDSIAQILGDRVYFTGQVSDDQLQQYFHYAETLAFPSLYEGFGLPPLEAMAAGCPVIVSTAASLPEVCGDAALYFDPTNVGDIAEKLLAILSDEGLRTLLIKKGLEHAKDFTWDSCIRQTCNVIRGLIEHDLKGVK